MIRVRQIHCPEPGIVHIVTEEGELYTRLLDDGKLKWMKWDIEGEINDNLNVS